MNRSHADNDIDKRFNALKARLKLPEWRRAYAFLDELRERRAEEVKQERNAPGRQLGLFEEEG